MELRHLHHFIAVALLPASMQNLQRRGAVYRRLQPPLVARIPLALGVRRGERSPMVQAFLAVAREETKKMVDAAASKAG